MTLVQDRSEAQSLATEVGRAYADSDSKALRIAKSIIGDVVIGDVPPGNLLQTESQLSTRFSVSRGVVREAMRIVAGTQLIETKHGVGSIVNSADRWNIFDPLVLDSHVETRSLPRIVDELIEVRRLVEVESAGLAAERVQPRALQTLELWHQRMEHVLEDAEAMAAADIGFHETILSAAGNRFLSTAMGYLKTVLTEARRRTAAQGGSSGRRTAFEAHGQILTAIRDREPDAAREAMRQHVVRAEGEIRVAILRLEPGESRIGV